MAAGAPELERKEAVRPRLEDRPDELLVAAAIEGDPFAFEDLVSRHRPGALRVATGIVGSTLAEDVVQDALLLAHRALASLQDRAKFSRWLLAIIRWRALRVGRLESRHAVGRVTLDDTDLETFSHLASDPRQIDAGDGVLLEALENIPPEYAEVIRYHFLHDLPHQKIANFLTVPLSTVKWRCFRGKEILRCTLSPEPTCPTVCRKGCAKYPSS
ncbi:MAG TPA: RNA polymerase sigma factor [Thermoanaerobaculia bacterium]|nr:RNA polymerase sigma factor [Thermoanaerobaculia bacterium]